MEAIITRIAHEINDCPKTNPASTVKAMYPIIKDERMIPQLVPSMFSLQLKFSTMVSFANMDPTI